MVCAIDQEVFCEPGQPVAAASDHDALPALPIYAGHRGQGPIDRVQRLALAHTQGFRLRRLEMGNDCGLAIGTASINVHNGNLVLSYGLPGGGPGDPPLRLYYNSIAHLDESPFGRGWSDLYHQWIEPNGSSSHSGGGTKTWLSRMSSTSGLEWTLLRDGNGLLERIIGPDGRTVEYAYDLNGQVRSITDAGGRTTSFEYQGRRALLTAITDPDGRRTELQYDRRFQLTTWRNANGDVTRFYYDNCFRIVGIRLPEGELTRFQYDAGPPRRVFVIDARNNRTELTLDADGNVTRSVSASGIAESFAWDAMQRLLSTTDGRGNTTQLSYEIMDDQSRRLARIDQPIGSLELRWDVATASLLSVVDENQNLTSLSWTQLDPDRYPGVVSRLVDATGGGYDLTWTAAAQLESVRDPIGATTRFSHDASYRRATVEDAEGGVTTHAYAATGLLTSTTDSVGAISQFDRDAAGLVRAVSDASGRTSFQRDLNGRIIKFTSPLGAERSRRFDANGRIVAEINPLQHRIEYTYDRTSNVITVRNRRGFVTTQIWDDLHRLLVSTGPLGDSTKFEYDEADNRTAATDPRGFTTRYLFDSNDRLIRVVDPLGQTTEYRYDAAGNRISTTDAEGNTVTEEWDELHRLTAIVDALQHRRTTKYDAAGHLASTTDALGHATTFRVDRLGRNIEVIDARGNATKYQYDALGRQTKIVDAENNSVLNVWDSLGRLVSVTDANAHVTAYTYDADGRVETMRDPRGRITKYEYDLAGNQIGSERLGYRTVTSYDEERNVISTMRFVGASTGIASQRTSQVWDANNRLIRTEAPEQVVNRYEYDMAGNRTAIVDPMGARSELTYDGGNRLVRAVAPDGGVTTYTFDRCNRPLSVTDANQHTQKREYDAAGRNIRVVDALQRATTYDLDAEGRILAKVDPLGRRWEFSYDEVGNLRTAKSPMGHVTTLEHDRVNRETATIDPRGNRATTKYDGVGAVLERVDAAGKKTGFRYDELGRLVSVTDALSNTTSYNFDDRFDKIAMAIGPRGFATMHVYDDAGNLISAISPLGSLTKFDYDGASRVVSVTSPEGRTVRYKYDACSRIIASINGEGHTTSREYDAMGRETALVTALGHRCEFTYDPVGNLVASTDPMGNVTRQVFDENNRLVELIDAEGRSTRIDLDAAGRASSKTDEASGRTVFSFDDDDRLISETDAAQNVTTYKYDANGNQTEIAKAGAETVQQDYDVLNRITEVRKLDRVSGARLHVIHETFDDIGRRLTRREVDLVKSTVTDYRWTYDAEGNTLREVSGTTDVSFTYDGENRRTEEALANGPVIRIDHDRDGLVTARTIDPGGHVTSYTYDRAGMTASVTTRGKTTTNTRDADGKIIFEENPPGPNGQHTDFRYTYNDAGWLLKKEEVASAGGVVLDTIIYTYDRTGKKLSETGSLTSWQYDVGGRLIREARVPTRRDWCRMSLADLESMDTAAWNDLLVCDPMLDTAITYDAIGNIISEVVDGSVRTNAYQFNRVVRRTSATGTETFAYDELGRRIEHASAAGVVKLSWTAAGTLESVELPNGARIAYAYDVNHLLRSRQALGLETRFVWVGDTLVAEADVAGRITRIHHTDPEGFGARLATTYLDTGETVTASYAQNGMVRRVYRGDEIVQELITRAHGDIAVVSSGPGDREPDPSETMAARFGGYRDAATGFIYLRQRWYDPDTRQFLSPDPLGLEDASDPNLYRYAGGDPVNHSDPSGLDYLDVDGNGNVYWQIETSSWWSKKTQRHALGRKRGDRLDFWQDFRGGYLPYNLVSTAAETIQGNGWDLARLPFEHQRRSIAGIIDKLRRGDLIDSTSADKGISGAAWEGLKAGAFNLADTFTFEKIDSLHKANLEQWEETGLSGTWAQTISNFGAVIAREAIIGLVTAGAGEAIGAARGGRAALEAAKDLGFAQRQFVRLGVALSGTSRAAGLARGGVRLVQAAGRTYDAAQSVIGVRDGLEQIKQGNSWGWLGVGLGALHATSLGLSAWSGIRRGLAGAARTNSVARRAWNRLRRIKGCGCFAGDVTVVTETGHVEIQHVSVGDRVLTLTDRERAVIATDPPATFAARMYRLELVIEARERIDVTLLRDADWIAARGATRGAQIELCIPELAIDGQARVVDVREHELAPASTVASRVVTGTLRRGPVPVMRVSFAGSEETVTVTASHAVWSVDQVRWVRVDELQVHERVLWLDCTAAIAAVETLRAAECVYNLEVDGDHAYRVGKHGWLVHNASELPLVTPYAADLFSREAADFRKLLLTNPQALAHLPGFHDISMIRNVAGYGNVAVFQYEVLESGLILRQPWLSGVYARCAEEGLLHYLSETHGAKNFQILEGYSEFQPCARCVRRLRNFAFTLAYHWRYRISAEFTRAQQAATKLEKLVQIGTVIGQTC